MKVWKGFLSLCLLVLSLFCVGKTDVQAATYNLPISDNWTDGELTVKGGYNYYRVTLPEAGTLTIRYQGLGIGYSYAYIYDEDLTKRYEKSELLGNTSEENPKTEDVVADLQKGTYMVRIHGHAGSSTGTYRLKASFKPTGGNEREPNDKYETAMPISGTQTIQGFLALNEDYDFYKFTLGRETFVSIRYVNHWNSAMPEPGVDGIIAVYDDNYQELHGERPINDEFLVNEKMAPGTYYIRISKFYGGSGKYILQFSDTHTHTWDDGKVTKDPTCKEAGEKVYTCTVCKETRKEAIAKTAHSYETTVTDSTCSKAGAKTEKCRVCGDTKVTPLPLKAHSYQTSVVKATTRKNGKYVRKCAVCGHDESTVIPYVKSLKLSKTSYLYDGKVKRPSVTVTDAKGKRLSSSSYSVSYSKGRKYIGTYKVTIRLKGNYTGSLSKTFKINPKAPKITSLKAAKRGFSLKWKKQSSRAASGYQVQYSANKSFKGGKILKVKGSTKDSLKKTGLTARKKYYVRVRTYKTISKKTYYSSWSAPKSVTAKR